MQLALASMATYHINFHYYSHTQHNSWHSYQTASPALQVVLDVGYFCSYACMVCLCLSVCWSRTVGKPSQNDWTDQDVVWLNGGTYTWMPLVNKIVMARKFLMKYNSWWCQLMINADIMMHLELNTMFIMFQQVLPKVIWEHPDPISRFAKVHFPQTDRPTDRPTHRPTG